MASVPHKERLLADYERQCVLDNGHPVISLPLCTVSSRELKAAEQMVAAHVHAVGKLCGEPTTYNIVDSDNGYYLQILTLGPPALVLHTLVAHQFGLGHYIDTELNWEGGETTVDPSDLDPDDSYEDDMPPPPPPPTGFELRQIHEQAVAGDIMLVQRCWYRILGDAIGEHVSSIDCQEVAKPVSPHTQHGWVPWFTVGAGSAVGHYRMLQPGDQVTAECVMRTSEGWERATEIHVGRTVEHGEQYGIPIEVGRP